MQDQQDKPLEESRSERQVKDARSLEVGKELGQCKPLARILLQKQQEQQW